MIRKTILVTALGLAGALGAGVASAHERNDVQWSVTIGAPIGQPIYAAPAPVYAQPAPVVAWRTNYRQPTRWDVDGDGIPNRYDRVYNPRWDRDADGIPDRYEHRYHHDRDDWRAERYERHERWEHGER